MSLNVGELVGYLRLDMSDFETGIAKGQALADKLDGKNIDVKVEADTALAEAKLAGVAASEDKVSKSGNDASKGMGAMVTAVLMLGSAIVPLAAGAAGLAVGFGAMGAAGVLAVVGIVKEMKAGTPLGLAYTGMLATLKGDLTTLGHTAASGTLAPFQQAVADLQKRMPILNGIVGDFSVITGKTAGVLTTGLVAAFIALAPLARDAGVYVLGLSTKFAAMMSGPGVVSFGDYIRSAFPQVMQAVESIVGAVIHLVAAIAPLGMGSLGILRVFSDLINAIPTENLALLVQLASSVYIGFMAFKMLSGPLESVGGALKFVGVSAETAAAGVRTLTIAAGVIGAIITVGTLLYSAHAESVRKNQQATNDYTEALRQSNGVIDENIRKIAFKSIQEVDGFRTGAQYGVTQKELVDAALNLGDAQSVVNAKLGAGVTALQEGKSYGEQYAAQGSDTAKKLAALGIVLNGNSAAIKGGIQGQKDWTAANATGTGITKVATQAMLDSATAHLSAAGATTAEMTAIKMLNTAMDAEISRALSLSGATSGVDQAVLSMTTTLKTNKGTLNEHTQAGIDDRRAIEGVAQSLQSQRDANIKAGMSTAEATVKYQASSAALLDQTGKLFGTTSQAYKYMKQLLAIPPSVNTTINADKIAAAANIAAIQAQVNTLLRSHPVVSIGTTGYAATYQYLRNIQSLVNSISGSKVRVAMGPGGSGGSTLADGGLIGGLAAGGPLPLPVGTSPLTQLNSLRKALS